MNWRLLLAALASLLLSALASADEYLLGPGDVLRISVYGQQDMTSEVRVSESGFITFPLVGLIKATGVPAAGLELKIADALKKGGFVNKPEVSALITAFRSKQISVLGQVNRPGKFNLETTSTVADLLAMAGGTLTNAAADEIVLIQQRDGKTSRKSIDLLALFNQGDFSLNDKVENGDVIFVPRAPVFYVYGEVQRPGVYRLERNMSVAQAIAAGGGLTLRGSDSRLQVKRRSNGKTIETNPIQLDDSLLADDVLVVKERVF
ncbi:MAG: polysaccharide export protein EpsE [Neisseriaceae bacterium]|nr:MAG: polysaccharide export protein EpsE [Neisseriaceae bacterium]